ncbi:hypothetical protein TanjilG_14842 [Lupinus angustifolius]|uniref:Uncharacterized protein n=1 Tax=Lupinus angustifolius TaxID=3871 RepID=A0A1J7GD39_LUPAN|nr:hypothetical protein TanjilG_01468 [Lupinus angustifolius]OIV98253.1 hypothetical protein TanjilG_14842 [Lupinus angustifolius]
MPLHNKIFVPIAQPITHQDKGISVKQRMGVGMVLSILAMVIAALVEIRRLVQSETVPRSILVTTTIENTNCGIFHC